MLRGDMSLVGPRPLLPETVAEFGEAGRRRGHRPAGAHRLGPGQRQHARSSDEDKLWLDLWYIDHRGLVLDLVILSRLSPCSRCGERIDAPRLAKARQHALRRYRFG